MGRNVYYLLRNPTFLFLCLAGTFDNGLVYGLSTFGPKYLESMYKITPTQAATYFGKKTLCKSHVSVVYTGDPQILQMLFGATRKISP